MMKYKIPREMFEPGPFAVYVSQRTSSDEWLKCGITSRASVAFRSCLNTQGHARAAADPRRHVLAGSWVPRRFAIIQPDTLADITMGDAVLRSLEKNTRNELKQHISDGPRLSLDKDYLREDYFRLPINVVWGAIARQLKAKELHHEVFDVFVA